jgi:UDP-glucose 4-epimerase
VLVTGGSGFIGSHVVDRLVASGHEPRIFDLVPSPYHNALVIEYLQGDLVEQESVRMAVRGCDAVIHLAAVSDVNKVLANPALAEAVNAGGTRAVLEAARLEYVPRVVYASTVWVYGSSNGNGPLGEDEPLSMPGHLYTATKLAGEMYCSSFDELYGLDTTIARFGIPYGPRARPATVLAAFVAKALADEPITIAGDGMQSRRFVYVEDLADGVVAALNPVASGRVYNLVGAENTTVREIAEKVTRVVRAVPILHVEGRPGDIQGAEISGERAKRELGWGATTSFDEGIRRYLEWLTTGNGHVAARSSARVTRGDPVARSESRISGSAEAVRRHEPGELYESAS